MEKKDSLTQNVSVFDGNLPSLETAKVAPISMNSEYWTPEKVGEKRRLFFLDLRVEAVIDAQSGETVDLTVLYFVDSNKNVIRQASRRLVGVFENRINSLRPGMAFEIEYLGKKKNATNSFQSDHWSVYELYLGQ
ncbi:MAG: hypothetical protein IKK27_10100 [Alistipes sp.]|nr:hypothetical protein [Alistipes sp.]